VAFDKTTVGVEEQSCTINLYLRVSQGPEAIENAVTYNMLIYLNLPLACSLSSQSIWANVSEGLTVEYLLYV
jgi:hypothetical protein